MVGQKFLNIFLSGRKGGHSCHFLNFVPFNQSCTQVTVYGEKSHLYLWALLWDSELRFLRFMPAWCCEILSLALKSSSCPLTLLCLVRAFSIFQSPPECQYLTKSFSSPLSLPPELIFHSHCHRIFFQSFIPVAFMAFHPFILWLAMLCAP